jgi:TolB protein
MHRLHRLLAAACLACLAGGAVLAGPPAAPAATIAFVSIRDGHPHIYLKAGAGPERQLTHGSSANTQPVWSPDGLQLAFTSTREGLGKVFLMDADGARMRRLTADDRIESAPSWSPDGRAIAFFSTDPRSASVELRIVDLHGGPAVTIGGDGRDKGPWPASWSADGRRLAFGALDARNKRQVWVVGRDGSGLREVSSAFTPRAKAFAALSPDGRHVAYVADMRESADLVLTEVDTLVSRNLALPGVAAKHENPRWSPDGRQLLFGSTREDPDLVRMDVFVMNADGTQLRNLTRHPHEDFDARWSGDAREVIFTSLRTGAAQVYAVDVAGGTTRRVTASASHDMDHAPRPAGAQAQQLSLHHHQQQDRR